MTNHVSPNLNIHLIAILAFSIHLVIVCLVLGGVWRSHGFSYQQKLGQSFLCVLLPIFGPLLILIFLKSDGTVRPKDRFEDEGPNA
jgi:hypothetical protein